MLLSRDSFIRAAQYIHIYITLDHIEFLLREASESASYILISSLLSSLYFHIFIYLLRENKILINVFPESPSIN